MPSKNPTTTPRVARRAMLPGDTHFVACTIAQCATCDELRYEEMPCLPCDLPKWLVQSATGTWKCSCFDWPDDAPSTEPEQ